MNRSTLPLAFANPFDVVRGLRDDERCDMFRRWVVTQPEVLQMASRDLQRLNLAQINAAHAPVLEELRDGRIAPYIPPRPILVFGSNLAGRYGRGMAALAARYYSARTGVGTGPTGGAYALPVQTSALAALPLQEIAKHAELFLMYANRHPEAVFQIARMACGVGFPYSDEDVAPLFAGAPSNVHLPGLWARLLGRESRLRLIIAGSRSITQRGWVHEAIDKTIAELDTPPSSVEIVSGGALGVDTLGEDWAVHNGAKLRRMPADWVRYGKGAGFVRNRQMGIYASHLQSFWNGSSSGTRDMNEFAKTAGLWVRIERSDAATDSLGVMSCTP